MAGLLMVDRVDDLVRAVFLVTVEVLGRASVTTVVEAVCA
jgi:hypothetical protein